MADTETRAWVNAVSRLGSASPPLPYVFILVIGLVLYVPFRATTLYHLDSVGFALSIHDFNLRLHQPGGLGYPLYVLALRAIKLLTAASDVDCIVALSIAATVLSAMFFYAFVASWAPRRALQFAILLLTSPVVWFNAEIPMSYPTGLLSSIVVAVVSLRLSQGSVSARYTLPAVWGLTAGFRPDVGVMVAPLAIYCARLELLKSKRYATTFFALAALGVGVWFVPLVLKSGGLLQYLGMVRGRVGSVSPMALALLGVFPAAAKLLIKNVLVVVACLLIGALGAVVWRLMTHAPLQHSSRLAEKARFLIAWFLPGFLVHAATTSGHSGYVLPYLPPLLLLVASGWRGVMIDPRRIPAPSSWTTFAFAGAVALQAAFFLFMPQQEGTFSGRWVSDALFRTVILEPTSSRIVRYDATIAYLTSEIHRKYPKDATLLIVPVAGELPNGLPVRPLFLQAKYYLPGWEQRVLYAAPLEVLRRAGMTGPVIAEVNRDKFHLVNTNLVVIPRSTRWVVWFCDAKTQPYRFDDSWASYSVGPGVDLVMVDMEQDTRGMRWGPFIFRREGSS